MNQTRRKSTNVAGPRLCGNRCWRNWRRSLWRRARLADRCLLTVEGLEVWEVFPPPGPAGPIQAKFRGLGAVPVWFVSWPELQALIADGVLTIGELESAATLLQGHADLYTETLHPPDLSLRHISIDAHGISENGTSFFFQAAVSLTDAGPTECCSNGPGQHVLIRFQ